MEEKGRLVGGNAGWRNSIDGKVEKRKIYQKVVI